MAQQTGIYYGPAAYEGFAKAFASKLGVSVSIGGTGAASVDATGTINLPDMHKYQTEKQFADTCATIIHEVAHVYYGSHAEFANYAHKAQLWRDCLNAVMDVADETGIGQREYNAGNSRAEQLLLGANANCYNDRYADLTETGKAPPHWQVLATGIIKARCMGKGLGVTNVRGKTLIGRRLQANMKQSHPTVDVAKAFGVLASARKAWGTKPRPRMMHWPLIRMAYKLETILRDVAPPPGSPETPMPNGAGHSSQAVAVGLVTVPVGGTEATEAQGAAVAANGPIPPAQTPQPSKSRSGTGAGGSGTDPDVKSACDDTRRMLEPVVRRIAQRMAVDGDSLTREGGYFAGTGVQDAYRVLTDGACMGRWQTDPHADGMAVAVVLDISDSMRSRMSATQGLAEAFAAGMADCGNVRRWTFGEQIHEVETFQSIRLEGDTQTALAVRAAHAWLMAQEAGKRVMVVLTDGVPSTYHSTPDACRETRQAGISLIGIALGDDRTRAKITASMPGAIIVQAEDAPRLALELENITSQLESLSV